MAYIIFSGASKEILKIAANDSDKDNLHFIRDVDIVKNISDADFEKIKLNHAYGTLVNDNVVLTDLIGRKFASSNELDMYIDNIKTIANAFLEANPSHPKFTEVNNYVTALNGVNTSSIIPDENTPLEMTWEKYCQDNGITFLHPLQIP